MSKRKSPPNKFSHYMKAPFRALIRARDMYVSSCTGYGGGRVVVSSSVTRNRSHAFYQSRTSSSEDDIRDLMRAASQGKLGPLNSTKLMKELSVVPRSQSAAVGVGITRIDENEACEFGDDKLKVGGDVLYPRSRSCDVVNKRRVGTLA